MIDNIELSEMSGGSTVSADDIGGGVKVQRVKVQYGSDGSATDVSSGAPLPVTITQSDIIRNYISTGSTIYSNATGDFVATANAGTKTITLSSYANAVLSTVIAERNFMLATIQRKASGSTNAIDTLPLTKVTFSSNVLTLADMTANFAAGDEVAVLLTGPDKSYDETNDATRSLNVGANGATLDSMTVKHATNHLMLEGVELIPKFAKISASTSGNNTIVAAVTGKKIRVIEFALSFAGTVNAKFQSGAAGTDLTGLYAGLAGGQVPGSFSPLGKFETASATLLNLNLDAAVLVGGYVVYVEV